MCVSEVYCILLSATCIYAKSLSYAGLVPANQAHNGTGNAWQFGQRAQIIMTSGAWPFPPPAAPSSFAANPLHSPPPPTVPRAAWCTCACDGMAHEATVGGGRFRQQATSSALSAKSRWPEYADSSHALPPLAPRGWYSWYGPQCAASGMHSRTPSVHAKKGAAFGLIAAEST